MSVTTPTKFALGHLRVNRRRHRDGYLVGVVSGEISFVIHDG
jgi:hypothetical protein